MRFFTSDSHLSHKNIIHLGNGRPFATVEAMNEHILEQAASVVGPEDTLYHLGDAALGNFDDSVKLLEAYPGGKKYLVPGNHDKVFPRLNSEERIARFKPRYEDAGFEVLDIHHEIKLTVHGELQTVLLSHVPYSPERYSGRADKLAFARPEDKGLWLIHGHTHSAGKASEHPREIHVGVDANSWTPVSEESIVAFIEAADA